MALSRARLTALAAGLTAAMAFSALAAFAIGALGPFLVADLGLTRSQLGSLISVLFGAGALVSVSLGTLVDRSGGRRAFAGLALVAAASLGGMALADGYVSLIGAVAVGGLALALSNPVTNRLVALHVDGRRRGLVIGIKQSGVQIGAFVAGLVLPPVAAVLGWRWALGTAALAAVLAAAGALAIPDGRAERPEVADTARRRGDGLCWLVVYALFMGLGISSLVAYLPLYAHERLGFSEATAGALASVVGGTAAAAGILWSWRSRRFGDVATPLTAIAGLGVPFLAFVAAAPEVGGWLLWAAAAGAGATAVAWNATGMIAVVTLTGSARAGRASGTVVFGFYVGFVAGPPAFGWAVDVGVPYAAAWAAVAVAFAGAALTTRLSPSLEIAAHRSSA